MGSVSQKIYASWDDLWDIQQQLRSLKELCDNQASEIRSSNSRLELLNEWVLEAKSENSKLLKSNQQLKKANSQLLDANLAHQSNIEDLVDTTSSLSIRVSILESKSGTSTTPLKQATVALPSASQVSPGSGSPPMDAGVLDRLKTLETFVDEYIPVDVAYLTNCANDSRENFKLIAEHVDQLDDLLYCESFPPETKMDRNARSINEMQEDLGCVKTSMATLRHHLSSLSLKVTGAVRKERKKRGEIVRRYNTVLTNFREQLLSLQQPAELAVKKRKLPPGSSPVPLLPTNRSLDDELLSEDPPAS